MNRASNQSFKQENPTTHYSFIITKIVLMKVIVIRVGHFMLLTLATRATNYGVHMVPRTLVHHVEVYHEASRMKSSA